jgi:alpha-glucosidase (family GH31 glycosyl hydrolase)
MNEPSCFSKIKTLPDNVLFELEDGKKYLHKDVHNVYGHEMANCTIDGLNKALDDTNERPFLLTRSGIIIK